LARSKLILLTSGFPFGSHETFLETEIKYLCEGFDQVQILAVDPTEETIRQVPDNCSVSIIRTQRSTRQKLKALSSILDPRVKAEIRSIKEVYGMTLSKGVLSTLLMSLQRAKAIEKQILPFIDEDRKTVLYSYWCDDSALALALLSEKRKALKTVCRIHRWDVYFEESAVGYLPYRHFITQHISKIFSISQDGIDYAKRVWKTGKEDKFELSRLGINNDHPLKVVERDYFLLVSCSNLIPVKRVHLIAEALQHLTDQRIKWVHIGDGPERNRIEESTKKFPKNIEVEFMGRIPNPAIYAYYDEQRPDLFINVSSSEGVPVSIMEAMSFGIPVLATDVGGNGEIVNEGNGKLLHLNAREEAICEALEKIANLDKDLKTQMRDEAYATWRSQCNALTNYNSFVQDLIHS
jgi:glycosyltransferase involved in cell wall biosynthesis